MRQRHFGIGVHDKRHLDLWTSSPSSSRIASTYRSEEKSSPESGSLQLNQTVGPVLVISCVFPTRSIK